MNALLTHLPHLGLTIVSVVLLIWMERTDRAAAVARAGEVGGGGRFPITGMRALGLVITVGFTMSVLGLVLLDLANSRPGWSLVLTYLLAGAAAACWAGWSVQRRLPSAVRERMGTTGIWMVGGVMTLIVLWGVVFGGLVLSQGVVLPSASIG
ncbi:MAG: hypothetical protein U0Y82_01215 [Thermoleophilia bacterium]